MPWECNFIYMSRLEILLADFVANPYTCQGADATEQYAPAAQPVAVVHKSTQPAPNEPTSGYAYPNHKLHHIQCSI